MARKLKTYQTSLGFFDMAIAAPSMKAALEAWGSKSNLFHQGFAKEVDDPDVIAATIVEARGHSRGAPSDQMARSWRRPNCRRTFPREKVKGRRNKLRAKPGKRPPRKIDDQAARKAALAYEKEQKQRDSQRRKEEAARAKERERREQAIAKAEAAMEEAERDHEQRAGAIDTERAALEQREQAEDERWNRQKAKLQEALRRARD